MNWTEKTLLFGDRRSLVGVVTDPPAAQHGSRRPAFVILNAGLLHRVGPNRVHVLIARELASEGFVVLRFDHSGIGDSAPRDDGLPFAAGAVRETREALDFLAKTRGVDRFALLGICSGADNAVAAASSDPRVTGTFLVDGYNVPTAVSRILYVYGRRLFSLESWGRLLTGRSQVWSAARDALESRNGPQADEPRDEPLLSSRETFVARVRSLTERGVKVLLLYTGESPAWVNYRRFMRRRIRSWAGRERLRVEHFPDSDHLFTLRSNRERLIQVVRDWARDLSEVAGRPAPSNVGETAPDEGGAGGRRPAAAGAATLEGREARDS